jgi:hypothetical protein
MALVRIPGSRGLRIPAAGGGGVTSVNGDSGPAVSLNAADVSAEPSGAVSTHAGLTDPHPNGFTLELRTSDPGSPADGRIWLRTDL